MLVKKSNITIRSAELEDAQILAKWWNNGAVMKHAGFPNGLGIPQEEVISLIKQNKNNLSQSCIIEVGGIRIGECSYKIKERASTIGIKICDASYQNKGFGSEILKLLIHYLFADVSLKSKVNIEKIMLDTNVDNARAQHVYEKLGFKKVATNINSWKNQLGQWQSSIDYEMKLTDYINLGY